MGFSWKSLAALVTTLSFAASIPAEILYKVEDLGTLPGDFESMPWGVNSRGDVVGSSNGREGLRAFIFTDEEGMVELPAIAEGARSLARDINDFGQVVGQSNKRAVRWDYLTSRDPFLAARYLDDKDRPSEAVAINNFGEASGWFEAPQSANPGNFFLKPGNRQAFFHSKTRGIVAIAPNGHGEGADINDAGQITGTFDGKAFFWDGYGIEDIGTIRGFKTYSAQGINDLGDIVGNATNEAQTLQHAFLFARGFGLADLGGVGDLNVLRRVNNNSTAVGQGRLEDGKLQGVIFTSGGGLRGLNELIADPGTWHIEFATDINDDGLIVASAWNTALKQRRAVRLVPALADDSCVTDCARSRIELAAVYNRDAATVSAIVGVADENGVPLAGAEVAIFWQTPGKSVDGLVTGRTNAKGEVRFETSGPHGKYTITLENVSAKGHTFDAQNSELSRSIDS